MHFRVRVNVQMADMLAGSDGRVSRQSGVKKQADCSRKLKIRLQLPSLSGRPPVCLIAAIS